MSNARRARTETDNTIEVEEIPLTQAEQDNLSVEESIAALFDASDENITWNCMVYEIDKSQGNAELYLFSILPDELPSLMDRLRDVHGTGTYRVRVYRKEGNKNRVFRQFDRRVKATPKAVAAPTQQNDLAVIIAAMERNNQRMIEAITANRQILAPQVPLDPFAQMTSMASAMGAMMTALRPAEGASSTDLILKGVQLAKELESGDKETGIYDIIKEALSSLPAIVKMSEAQNTALPPTPVKTQLPAPNNTAVKPLPTATPQGQISPEMQAQQQIRNTVIYLIPKAAKGSDPALYAELLADDLGLEMCTALLGQPDLLTQLQIIAPETVPHIAWFQRLLAELGDLVNDARAAAPGRDDALREPNPAVHSLLHTGWPGGGESDTEDNE